MEQPNLNAALLEVVKASLPEQTCAALREIVEEYPKLKEQNAALTKAAVANEKTIEELQSERDAVKKLGAQLTKDREEHDSVMQALHFCQQKFAVEQKLVELREAHAKERVSDIRFLTETVFRNQRAVYAATTNGTRERSVPDAHGYMQTVVENKNEATTTTELDPA